MTNSILDTTRSAATAPASRRAPFPVAFGLALMATSAVATAPALGAWSVLTPIVHRAVPAAYGSTPTTSDGVIRFHSSVGLKSGASSAASNAAELRAISGLTANQIGRMFGVSRRSVQNWLAGAPMARQHEERMALLISQIRVLGSTPDTRRAALLHGADGGSLFHRFVSEIQQDAIVQLTSMSVREQLGA